MDDQTQNQIIWRDGYQLAAGDNGVFVIAPDDRKIYHYIDDKSELLKRFWHSNGPDDQAAEQFLRSNQRLIYPLWNELLVDLAEIGAVDLAHDRMAGKLQTSESMIWKRLLPSIRLFGLPSPKLLLPVFLSIPLSLAALLFLIVALTGAAWYDLGSGAYGQLMHKDTLLAFVAVFFAVLTLLYWRTAGVLGALLHTQFPPPTVELIAGFPVIQRHYVYAHLLSRLKKIQLGGSGFVILACSMLLVLAGDLVFGPVPVVTGAYAAVCTLFVISLLPFWESDGAIYVEGILGLNNLRKSLYTRFLYRWMPRRSVMRRRAQGEFRIILLVLFVVAALFAAGWFLDTTQSIILLAPEFDDNGIIKNLWMGIWLFGFLALLAVLAGFSGGLLLDYVRLVRPRGYRVVAMKTDEFQASLKMLSQQTIFYGLGERVLGDLVQRSRLVRVYPGHYVIREGEVGNSFFLLITGEVVVEKETVTGAPMRLAVLQSGSGFGELSLLHNVPRTASVKSPGKSRLLTISGADFLSWLADTGLTMEDAAERIRLSQIVSLSPLLHDLPAACITGLVSEATSVIFEAEQKIIQEDEDGEDFFLIVEGTVSVRKKDIELAELGPGEIVGEMALLSGKKRNASVFAKTRVKALSVEAVDFWAILEEYPIFRQAAQSLAKTRRGLSQ